MSRQLLVTGAVLLSLLGGVSACSGGDDKPDSKPTATESTTAAPTPEPQPTGADGVTYEVINWDDYAADPVVLAYKTVSESRTASLNSGKLLPAAREGQNKARVRKLVKNMAIVERNSWNFPTTAKVRVRDVKVTGRMAVLTMCVWRPSVLVHDKNGKVVGSPDRYWDREVSKLTQSAGRWVITAVDVSGKCPGGAPA